MDDRSWSEPVEVASGPDWFINWADFPSVVPADTGPWAAHWLQQKPGGVYAYDVMTTLSDDGGRTWGEPRSPHDDGTPTEHGFVSMAQVGNQPYAVWLDGRATAGEGHAHGADHHGPAPGAMTLRGALLQPQGAVAGVEIDARVCDCCQTDTAATRDALVVVYRDRAADETRDILAARLVDGVWSKPVVVHADGWRIDACPVNGPAVAADGDTVVVAWFTAPDQPRVRLAFSQDGGRSFAPPIEVASGKVVGRVDVVALTAGRAVVSWLGRRRAGRHGSCATVHCCRRGGSGCGRGAGRRGAFVRLSTAGARPGRTVVRMDGRRTRAKGPHCLCTAALRAARTLRRGRCASISPPFFQRTRFIGAR